MLFAAAPQQRLLLGVPGSCHARLQVPHGASRLGPRAAKRQTERSSREADSLDQVAAPLPTNAQELANLAKDELQRQLELRGLDKSGDKEQLANRLLDSLIAQESAISASPAGAAADAAPAGRRSRRSSRRATASAEPATAHAKPEPAGNVVAAAATAPPPEAPAPEAAAPSRRGRKASRKATTSADPLAAAAEAAVAEAAASAVSALESAGAEASKQHGRRGRRTSRKGTVSMEPQLEDAAAAAAGSGGADEAVPAAAAAAAVSEAEGGAAAARRARKTSRKATTSADPQPDVPAASASGQAGSNSSSKRGRPRKSSVLEPTAEGGASDAAVAAAPKAGRGRRSTRKSSVVEPDATPAPADAAAPSAAAASPTQQHSRRRSSAKTSSAAPSDVAAAAATSSSTHSSKAKLLAQQLAKKEIAVHGHSHGAAAGAAAAAAAPTAAPGSSWVVPEELVSPGSQAQSDALLLAADDSSLQASPGLSTSTADNGSVDEVLAQLSAERGAGGLLADEPQPAAIQGPQLADIAAAADAQPAAYMESMVEASAATDTETASDDALSAFDHLLLPPSAGAADAAATRAAGAADACAPAGQQQKQQQVPTLGDVRAAVEEPLGTGASAAAPDEAPDVAMSAFDHVALDTPAAAAVAAGNQSPNLHDIALAAEDPPLPASMNEDSLGEDEEPDAALAAFDHMVPEPPHDPAAAAAAGAAIASNGSGAAASNGYDQAFLDPLQPSAGVGSGSVDGADEQQELRAASNGAGASGAAVPAEKAVGAPAPGSADAPDVGELLRRWVASVVQMFEEWQKNLSGPK